MGDDNHTCRIAANLLAFGLTVSPGTPLNEVEILTEALQNRYPIHPRHFNVAFRIDNGRNAAEYRSDPAAVFAEVLDYNWVEILPKLAAIEERIPNAGAALLHLMDRAGSATCGIGTPETAFWYAQRYYWMGYEDEKEYIEELKAQKEDPANYDILKKEEFLAMPSWYWQASERKTVDLDRLKKHRSLRSVLDAAGALETEMDALGAHRLLEIPECCDDYFPALVVADSAFPFIGQIYDTVGEDLSNSGVHYTTIGQFRGDPLKKEDVPALIRDMDRFYNTLLALDTLITAVENVPEKI